MFGFFKRKKFGKFLPEWKVLLAEHVAFYFALNDKDKRSFEKQVLEFLNEKSIVCIDVEAEPLDLLLVASSAVIPLFHASDWNYRFLHEVYLVKNAVNLYPQFGINFGLISGMVQMSSGRTIMVLSQTALRSGFHNQSDRRNVGIHEFAHLIDMMDGVIDGVPKALLGEHGVDPWLELMRSKTLEIIEGENNINNYAATKPAEFFAVLTEYFFEDPERLKSKHPDLYSLLAKSFKVSLADRFKDTLKHWLGFRSKWEVGRNDPCPCGSGKKYKKCHFLNEQNV